MPLELIVSPNPVSEKINIQLSGKAIIKDFSIIIYNALGEVFLQNKYSGNEIRIDVSLFPIGIYFIKIKKRRKYSY